MEQTEKDADYGDFEEIKEPNENKTPAQLENIPSRVRLPGHKQLIGIVLERLGGKRMSVKSADGKIRNSRVPGRFKRKFWLRPGQAVIIQPWEFNDEHADILYQYRPNEVYQLKKRGFFKKLDNEF